MKLYKSMMIPASLLLVLATSLVQAVETSFEKDTSVPLFHVSVAIPGGAASDPKETLGLTQFMGRVMLRGTRSKTKNQINLLLDQLGAKLGVETRQEFLIFRGSVLSENREEFLQLLGEILTQPSFDEKEVRLLKDETISGLLEALGNDGALARYWFDRLFFRGHPYGNPIYGTTAGIRAITGARLRNQFASLLQPEKILLVGTGDGSSGNLSTLARKLEDGLKNSNGIQVQSEVEPLKGIHVYLIDKPGISQSQVQVGLPGVTANDPRYIALSFVNHQFGGGSFRSRLMKELRVKRGWTYGAGSNMRLATRPHSWKMGWFPHADKTAESIGVSLRMLKDLKDKGLTQTEFAETKEGLIRNSGFMYNTAAKRIENDLTERMLKLPEGFFRDYRKKLEALSLTEVNDAAHAYFRENAIVVLVLGDAKSLKEPIAKTLKIPSTQIEVMSFKDGI